MKIGVYVGSFNPIHFAHLKIASQFLNSKLLDKIIFVPAGDEYEKKGLESGKHRFQMVKIATQNNPNFLVSDIEIKHRKLSTYKTLEIFREEYPNDEIVLIMGADNLKEIYWWDHADVLLSQYKIYVMTRNGLHQENFPEYKDNKNILFINFDIDICATNIRKDIENQRFDEAIKNVPLEVVEYIKTNKLYGAK